MVKWSKYGHYRNEVSVLIEKEETWLRDTRSKLDFSFNIGIGFG
jgi:hypothetical protein